MSGKLTNYDNVPLPQDLSEGVDESEWVRLYYFLCFAYFCLIYPFLVYVLPDSLLPVKTITGKLKTLKLESGWKISDQLVETTSMVLNDVFLQVLRERSVYRMTWSNTCFVHVLGWLSCWEERDHHVLTPT